MKKATITVASGNTGTLDVGEMVELRDDTSGELIWQAELTERVRVAWPIHGVMVDSKLSPKEFKDSKIHSDEPSSGNY